MPSHSRSGPKSDDQGKDVRLLCYQCDRVTVHSVVRSVEYDDEYSDGDFSVYSQDAYQIVECRGCESLGFRHTHSNSEDYDNDPDTGEMITNVKMELFPSRVAGRTEIDDAFTLPREIHSIYSETLAALRGGLPVLAGIGVRAIVETVCREREASGVNLAQRIDALVTQGVLTRDGSSVLHSLRVLGNEAAHEVKPHSLGTLNVAMDVVDHLLMGVYIIPARATRLPARPAD